MQRGDVYRTVGKRSADFVLSALLLFLSIPLLLGIAVAVKVTSRGRVLFCQQRVGRDGRSFRCVKFRTMSPDAPSRCPAADLTDAERYLTPIGGFLRRSSLDELPQLWNVLRGEMSIVGPRPLLGEEETVHRLRRKNGSWRLRPGLTGLAQISGRNGISDLRKAELDGEYAKRVSLGTDCAILLRTVGAVWSGRGVEGQRRTPDGSSEENPRIE